MSLSIEQVRHVANLARLKLTDEEEKTFAGQLSAVLDYINQLNELDTDNVTPTSHALDIKNVMREDEVKKPFGEEVWKENAPASDHGHFRVPKVIGD